MKNAKIDYSGRTVDLLLLKTILKVPASERVRLDASGDPMVVSGVEKMVQRYAVSFLNALGSTKFRGRHGTRLMPAAGSGLIYNAATLKAAAAEANLLALLELQEADSDDTPDDERISESEIYELDFSRAEATARISVRLTSRVGKSFIYIIPVPVGVGR